MTYLDFFGLHEKPFSLTPDPSFFYLSRSHKQALAFLQYGLNESKGFLQLTGPIGSGKTILLRSLLSQLDERTKAAYIFNPAAPFPHLLRSIMKDLHLENIPATRDKFELLDFLQAHLFTEAKRRNQVVVIIDEAQNLGVKNLGEIRTFSDFETGKEKLIQIVLAGQPELVQLINRPELRQMKQRIRTPHRLGPLQPGEVKDYIEHRLKIAGSDGELDFTDEACQIIFQYSEGIPRLINSICDAALLIGCTKKMKTINDIIINEAVGEVNGSHENEAMMDNFTPSPARNDLYPPKVKERELSGDRRSNSSFSSDSNQDVAEPERNDAKQEDLAVRILAFESSKENEETIALPDPARENFAASNFLPQITEVGKTENDDLFLKAQPVLADAALQQESNNCETSTEIENIEDKLHSEGLMNSQKQILQTETAPRKRSGILKNLLKLIGAEASTVPASTPEVQGDEGDAFLQERLDSSSPFHKPKFTDFEQKTPQVDLLILHLYYGFIRILRALLFWKISQIPKDYLLTEEIPEGFINSKIMILFKEAGCVQGTVENLDLQEPGFYFTPLEKKEGERKYLLHEQILSAKLVDNFHEPWQKKFVYSGKSPKGRQVVVTLQNGEVIEGIFLNKLEPQDDRFFLVSPNDAGNPSWVLIEKSGTAGILTERFKTGIYDEEFIPLPEIVREEADYKVDPHEAKGDFLFSINDFRSASSEYEDVPNPDMLPNRVQMKIAACHFNRGIQYLHGNRYADARREFILAAVHNNLRIRALAKTDMIDRLLNGHSSLNL